MRYFSNILRPLFVVTTFLSLLGADAIAHIDLQSPISRYTNRDLNRACPCGVGEPGNNRLCALPDDRSDPDRSASRVTTLVAGSTLVFRFDEYVDHSGHYRIAFDNEGADLSDFNENILLDVVDPVGVTGSNGNAGGSMWELEITVPNTPCTNCTLQLIQVMNGNTVDEVLGDWCFLMEPIQIG
ncbi:MAG: hypothetical protein GY822_06555 [Deltaproteobacteria bacterium]|nr:hypothetical protein [Deltaproteobacteria bacterium]